MSDSSRVAGGGVSLTGVVWVILIACKISGSLSWHWIAVILFPIWLPFAFIFGVLGLILAIGVIGLGLFLGGFLIYSALKNFKLIAP